MSDPTPVRRSSPWARAAIWIVAVAVVGALAWWLSRDDRPPAVPSEVPGVPEVETTPEADDAGREAERAEDEAARRWREVTGSAPVWPDPLVPDSCDRAMEDLRTLCAVLDERDYVRAHRHEGGACGFLARVGADLESNPPPIHGELRDLIDVRHSVAHLYRSLGEKRVVHLAEILALEPELLEPGALALYRWSAAGGTCDPPAPGPRARYEYAAWLLRTIGGQAYLRRRAPRIEALATFYALRTLDASVESGFDPAGVDLTHDIARALDMIRVRDDLVFRDAYVDDLEAMRDRWIRRTGGVTR